MVDKNTVRTYRINQVFRFVFSEKTNHISYVRNMFWATILNKYHEKKDNMFW